MSLRFDCELLKDNDEMCPYFAGLSSSIFDIACSYTILEIIT